MSRRPTPLEDGICPAQRHNTRSAYDWWGCRCPEAREAHRLMRKRRREGRYESPLISPIGTARRLQALVAIGHPWAHLAARLGVSTKRAAELGKRTDGHVHRDTAAKVDALFEELSATPGTSKYALTLARKHGYLPPLWWDDIDNPDEDPLANVEARETDPDVVDEIAVDRALRGWRIELNDAEKHLAVHLGRARGHALATVAVALRLNYDKAKSLAAKPLPVAA